MSQNQNSQNNNQLKYHLGNSSSSNSSQIYDTQIEILKNSIYSSQKVPLKFKSLKKFMNVIFPNNTMENKYNNMRNLLDTDILFYTIFLKRSYSYHKYITLEKLKETVQILEKPTTKTRYIHIRNGVYKKNNNSVTKQGVQQNVKNNNSVKKQDKINNVDYDLFNKDNENININVNNNNKKYANFHNLTFLYDKDYHSIKDFYHIESKEKIKYFEKIREYISRNKNKIKDGDIIFIGSTYETRQEYGFAIVEMNDFINKEFPDIKKYLENGKEIYYKKAIDKVNNFWRKYEGLDYFNEDDIKEAKENKYYKPNNNN
jgi:hypothetical protein